MNSNWYAMAVQPRKEAFVAQQLERDGFPVACPCFKKLVRHARQTKSVHAPLFPGYLFVELAHDAVSWRKVNWVAGSIGLIRFQGRPAPLERHFVENYLVPMRHDGIVEFSQSLKSGDRVQAIGGPFDRCIGEVVGLSDDQRVKILMDALNRKIETTLPIKSVISAA